MSSKAASASFQRRCGRVFLALTTLQLTEQELGARAFEPHRDPVVLDQGLARHLFGRVDVTSGGQ